MSIQHTDVVVAGGGPVGLAAALFLHAQGRDVIVAEEKPHGTTHSYALALHPASLNLLEALDVVEELLAQSRRVSKVAIYSGNRRIAEVPVATERARHPYLAITGQDVLERILAGALKKAGVPIWWNNRCARFEQDTDKVSIQLDEFEDGVTGYAAARFERMVRKNRQIEARHLIGADGHASLVRRQLGVQFPEVAPAEHFAVFECQLAQPLPDEVALVLDPAGIGVLWPLPGGRGRWSFAVDPAEFESASWREKDHAPVQLTGAGICPTLDQSYLDRLLKERAPWFKAGVERVYWRILVRFERRLAEAFGRGRVWLTGDAAHLGGPVGIQSMNVGLAEARALAGAVVQDSHSRGDGSRLAEYNHQCLQHWQHLLGLAGRVTARSDAAPEIVRFKDKLPACLPAYGRPLTHMAGALGLTMEAYEFEVPGIPEPV